MRKKKVITGLEDIQILNPEDKKLIYSSVQMDSRCPRRLNNLPTEPCKMALNSIYEQGSVEQRCEWSIIHGDSNYCFFAYQCFNNRSHTLDEISSLLSSTITSVDLQVKRSIFKLKKKFRNEEQFIKACMGEEDEDVN